MQIANERIVINEIVPNNEPSSNNDQIWCPFTFSSAPFLFEECPPGTEITARWHAALNGTRTIAWGAIIPSINIPEGVVLSAIVVNDYRRLGLGRFMIRLATDQAIRYRKRTIMAEVENTNEGALKILDEEDFEKQPEQHPGYTLLKKELKWI